MSRRGWPGRSASGRAAHAVLLVACLWPPAGACADWLATAWSSTETPNALALGIASGGIVVLTVSESAAGGEVLDCLHAPDPFGAPSEFEQTPIEQGADLALARRALKTSDGLTTAVLGDSTLQLLLADERTPCAWARQPITDTNRYTYVDFAELDGDPVVMVYDAALARVDVYTATTIGQLELGSVLTAARGIAGPDLVAPVVSAGAGLVCVSAMAVATGYFTECSGLGSEHVVEHGGVPPVGSHAVAGFLAGGHNLVYPDGQRVLFTRVAPEDPYTMSLGRVPLGGAPFGIGMTEGTEGRIRVMWPGHDVEIDPSGPITGTLSGYPIDNAGLIEAGRLFQGWVTVQNGSLLLATFSAHQPVPMARWAMLALALLLMILALAAQRRAPRY